MIDSTTMSTNRNIFQLNSQPTAERKVGLESRSGTPPNRVPLGQMYLQNHGSPMPVIPTTVIGSRMTNSTSTTYLRYLSHW